MDSSIDITDTAFSLANIPLPAVNEINEVISSTSESILDTAENILDTAENILESDNLSLIYFIIGFIILICGIFMYSYYSNKKKVTFQDKLDDCYGDVCQPRRTREF
jgi:membrane-associated HD superfamily phosphohydrolase